MVSARRSAIGRPRPSISSAMLTPGWARSPSSWRAALVGVGEPAVGLEPGERDRQLVEEVVGHQAGDLGAVERHQQQVAAAVGAGDHHGAHRLAGAGEQVHAVGAQRQVGEDVVERSGGAGGERGGGGVGREHAPLGVDAQPGHAGRRRIGRAARRRARRARCARAARGGRCG